MVEWKIGQQQGKEAVKQIHCTFRENILVLYSYYSIWWSTASSGNMDPEDKWGNYSYTTTPTLGKVSREALYLSSDTVVCPLLVNERSSRGVYWAAGH